MDLIELDNTLKNRKMGIAYECYMIGTLSRTALAKEIPDKPEEVFPWMFPKPKTYEMPDYLKEKYYKERGEKIG